MADFLEPNRRIECTEATVGEFWAWAFSDIVSNDLRGAFAEFLVGCALGVLDRPRVSWDATDLSYRGESIEVKASGRWQSWPQERPSRISFGIPARRGWDARSGSRAEEATRSAAAYVFACHLPYPASVSEVLDPSTWTFFVIPTWVLDETRPSQKTISLGALTGLTDSVAYGELRAAVDEALANHPV